MTSPGLLRTHSFNFYQKTRTKSFTMSGGKKKKSAAKRKNAPKPAKFSVASVSPVRTRSKVKVPSKSAAKDVSPDATPTPVMEPLIPSPSAVTPESGSNSVAELEKRFGERMSQMETNFRSTISEMSLAGASRKTGKSRRRASPAAAAAASPDRWSPDRGRSSRSSSSSSDSSFTSDSSRSSSSSADSSDHESRHRHRHRRHRSRRRRTRSRTSSRKRRGKYCTAKYLKDGDKVDSYSRLVLANLRMTLALYKKEKDVKGFLKHQILIAEKADKDMFEPASLIGYDESIKEIARESGSKSFEKVNPATIVKHLSYDGTRAANSSREEI